MRTAGIIIQALGDVIVAFTVLRVHHRMMMEHKIDNRVVRVMRREQQVGFTGIALIIIGTYLQVAAP
ncbi:MAG: Uncharacterized protein G01um101431_264 [Parcubacteria group bacterium Gr01-1014_31]|nr:MAG: Uncharacterized protein G01um101431_264 [Parcubacteria group bacterium Gr01-1014_31]